MGRPATVIRKAVSSALREVDGIVDRFAGFSAAHEFSEPRVVDLKSVTAVKRLIARLSTLRQAGPEAHARELGIEIEFASAGIDYALVALQKLSFFTTAISH